MPRLTRLCFTVMLVALLLGPAFGQSDDLPTIVVRVDDCHVSWIWPRDSLNGLSPMQYARNKRIPILWATIVDWADSGQGIPWSDLQAYLDDAGGEIASHSYHHIALSSIDQAIAEVTSSKQAIDSHISGHPCTTFIQPGSWFGPASICTYAQLNEPLAQAIANTYQQSMSYVVNGIQVGTAHYPHEFMSQVGFDTRSRAWTPQLSDATLDAVAASPGMMCVYQLHNVGANSSIQIDETTYRAFIDKLAALRDAGKIRICSLADACSRTVSPGVNLIPDPGFEVRSKAAVTPVLPWTWTFGTWFSASGGVNNSGCAKLPDSTTSVGPSPLALAPGTYQFSWQQRVKLGTSQSTGLVVSAKLGGASPKRPEIDGATYRNASPSSWEAKSAWIVVPELMPITEITLRPGQGDAFDVDELSLVRLADPDPAVSAIAVQVAPTPRQCAISWVTPSGGAADSIRVRYSTTTYPRTPDEGQALATFTGLIPGVRQQVTAPIDWTVANAVYFSVFALTAGNPSQPGLTMIKVDRTVPQQPKVTVSRVSADSVHISWTPCSGCYDYHYAVGNQPGKTNILDWTATSDVSAEPSGLPANQPLSISVQSENIFGISSLAGITDLQSSMVSAKKQPNGVQVTLYGCVVTAVFQDCIYVAAPETGAGIKVIGKSGVQLGDTITVTGLMDTDAGERLIRVPPDPQ